MFYYEKQYGYSNYTVEGSLPRCALGENPKFDASDLDVPYDADRYPDRWEPGLYATECKHYTKGQHLGTIDVEDDEKELIAKVQHIGKVYAQLGYDGAVAAAIGFIEPPPQETKDDDY